MKTAKTTILIDKRNKDDILDEFGKLSANYVPEWKFSTEDPDVGSTLGILYAGQVEDNVNRINQIVDRYHSEFVNLLDISVESAKPAESICLMELVQDTIPGTVVDAGTRLVSGVAEKGSVSLPVIFETTENVYITGSKIRSAFMTDGEDGSIIPLLGQVNLPDILNPYETEEESSLESNPEDLSDYLAGEASLPEEEGFDPTKPLFESFTLFGEKGGVQQNALLFYHSYLFEGEGDYIFIRIEGNDELISDIVEKRKRFFYSCEGKLIPVEEVRLLNDNKTFSLVKRNKEDKQKIDNQPYSMLALIDAYPITEDMEVSKIHFSAMGDFHPAEFVGNNSTDMDPEDFKPLGEVMSIYQECYIGDDSCFSKKGAKVTVSFNMEFGLKTENLTIEEEEEELKVVKRKPRNVIASIPAEVFAQEISVEYFNGIGYRKLPFDQEVRFLFAEGQAAKMELTFVVPDDFESTEVGGFSGRALRIQLLKADNCYLRPAVHHYPRITGLKLRYSYENRYMRPDYMYSYYGTKKVNLSGTVNRNEKFVAFRRTGYEQDALYIGLDKRPEKGPVSLFFKLREGKRYEPIKLRMEYSSRTGFKRLKVIDDTLSLSKSGLISFIPPSDFYEKELEGNREYWVRILRMPDEAETSGEILPKIEDIRLNGVRVMNVETQTEEEFYIDTITPGQRFTLGYDGILDAEVWVNEFDVRTPIQMREMLAENPRDIRTEYDIQGNISAFYVKYHEVDRFENSEDKRVYILDRLTHELIFGDGIHTYVPSTLSDAALRVRVRCSDGSLGNVGEYEINASLSEMLFIGNVYNPIKGYGGSDMETVDSALNRGANIISGRHRLISMKDYIREISSFSDLIHQVVCVRDHDGRGVKEDGALTFLILLKDYKDGSYSFHKMEEDLRNHLLKNCEMTIPANKVYLAEPTFVEISVVAWVKANRMHDSFEIQSSITEAMEEYFDPALENGENWNIGMLPTPSQIQMRMNIFKHEAVIENVAILARYSDVNGYHEQHLKDVEVTPFMVCVSGKHDIHVDI